MVAPQKPHGHTTNKDKMSQQRQLAGPPGWKEYASNRRVAALAAGRPHSLPAQEFRLVRHPEEPPGTCTIFCTPLILSPLRIPCKVFCETRTKTSIPRVQKTGPQTMTWNHAAFPKISGGRSPGSSKNCTTAFFAQMATSRNRLFL